MNNRTRKRKIQARITKNNRYFWRADASWKEFQSMAGHILHLAIFEELGGLFQ